MQTKTLTISPGGAEEFVFDKPLVVKLLMTSDDDVVWLQASRGPLDTTVAARLDKAQCPVEFVWQGPLAIHSPVQGGRTVQVSLIIGGAA